MVVTQLLIERLGPLSGEDGGKRQSQHGVSEERRGAASRGGVPHSTVVLDELPRRRSSTPFHTRRRCRPTDAALPNKPISIPNPTMASACSREKNATWSSQRLMRT